MKIHAQHIVAKPMDGTYDEIWMSQSKWRREIIFSGFDQVEVGDADSKWVTRNLDFRPRVAYFTAIALENFIKPELIPGEKIMPRRSQKRNGLELQCVQMEAGHSNRELCFEPSGVLAIEERQNQRFEYEDFRKFGEKILPGRIRVSEAEKEVVDITVEDPTGPPDPVPTFEHAAAAIQMAPCEHWPAEPVKRVQPEYPQNARQARQQGTVVLYGLLSGDGRLSKLNVLESAGATLDRSATDSVRQWVYSPLTCGAASLQSEIEIRVNYSLTVH